MSQLDEDRQLLDRRSRPLRDLRISVTDRCNFRCTYCMPAEIFGEKYEFLKRSKLLTFEEITRVARIMVDLGVVKLRLTGGEPLVRQELEKLVAMLRGIDGVQDIAMTTNAMLLPGKAQLLADAGLDRVTISLDSLDEAVFKQMNGGRGSVAEVLRGIEAAEAAGLGPIKINTVVQRGVNDHTLVDLARFCKEHGYILRFIEYMDVGTRNGWDLSQVVTAEQIVEQINTALPLEAIPPNYYGETALRYRYQDGGGEMGVIASVTRAFCGTCTRMRLSPEGQLFTCLFAVKGTDLRELVRGDADDEAIRDRITGVWRRRADRYSEVRSEQMDERKAHKIEMYYIGG